MAHPIETPSLAQVFTALFSSRDKLTSAQVAEKIGSADVARVAGTMQKVFLADLLHMKVIDAAWRYGITARARRIVCAVGLDGVTDDLIMSEYSDAMAWRPRRTWNTPTA